MIINNSLASTYITDVAIPIIVGFCLVPPFSAFKGKYSSLENKQLCLFANPLKRKFYQWITHIFVHDDYNGMGLNLLSGLYDGYRVYQEFGATGFYSIFFGGSLLKTFVALYTSNPVGNGLIYDVAGGGVSALAGCHLVLVCQDIRKCCIQLSIENEYPHIKNEEKINSLKWSLALNSLALLWSTTFLNKFCFPKISCKSNNITDVSSLCAILGFGFAATFGVLKSTKRSIFK